MSCGPVPELAEALELGQLQLSMRLQKLEAGPLLLMPGMHGKTAFCGSPRPCFDRLPCAHKHSCRTNSFIWAATFAACKWNFCLSEILCPINTPLFRLQLSSLECSLDLGGFTSLPHPEDNNFVATWRDMWNIHKRTGCALASPPML